MSMLLGLFMAINISLIPNQTEGVAPLAVLFDASATTSTTSENTFHDLSFEWKFERRSNERWEHSYRRTSKDFGPIVGHVFTDPGTYRVRLKVKNKEGEIAVKRIKILVKDPNRIFYGNNTICVSQDGNFQGAPNGAMHLTTTDFNEVSPFLQQNGKRILLRRGEIWGINSTYKINNTSQGILGAFGNGSDQPELKLSASGASIFNLSSSRSASLSHFKIQDLTLSTSQMDNEAIKAHGNCSFISFHNLEILNFEKGIQLSNWDPDLQEVDFHDIAFSNCSISNIIGESNTGKGGYGIYMEARNVLILGCRLYDAELGEHLLRTPLLQKAFIAHNLLEKAPQTKHLFKLHGGNFNVQEGIASTRNRYSEKVLIANNIFKGSLNQWNVAIGPQSKNTKYDERIRDVIIEKNFFLPNQPSTQNNVHLVINAQKVSIRNNLFSLDNNGTNNITAIDVFKRASEPAPIQINILNNTAVAQNREEKVFFINSSNDVMQSTFQNNLFYCPSSRASLFNNISSFVNVNNNLDLRNDPGFTGNDFNYRSSYRLRNNASPINQGITVAIFRDFFDRKRSDRSIDVGAYEK